MKDLTKYTHRYSITAADMDTRYRMTPNAVLKKYNLGSKSNISRIQETLIKKELIEKSGRMVTIADPVFRLWMLRENINSLR